MEFPPELFKVKVHGEGRIITPEEKAGDSVNDEPNDSESVNDEPGNG